MGLATARATREVSRSACRGRIAGFAHVRSTGRKEPGSAIESVAEVIGAAAVTGASLHIAHMNSSGAKDAPACLALVEGARARGLDVTTEAYPYGAGMTEVNSAIFGPGWQEKLGLDYADLELPGHGRAADPRAIRSAPRLAGPAPHPDPHEPGRDRGRGHPPSPVMVASDGLRLHPRNVGTYARVLSRYVRSQQSLTLMDALRMISLMPARRLETATLAARRKGRLQEGADGDVVVYDPASIADRATYRSPAEPSVGVRFLLVSGTVVVEGGRVVEGVFPAAVW
jgi:N-acyl-D-aspartate/D-glutamate deacylase